ncbi:MAG TPA: hypothetical protein VFZ34_10565 [Blastocatellia bacterium]|nr:hypothetical protein [Blastocatellia bacterium]
MEKTKGKRQIAKANVYSGTKPFFDLNTYAFLPTEEESYKKRADLLPFAICLLPFDFLLGFVNKTNLNIFHQQGSTYEQPDQFL